MKSPKFKKIGLVVKYRHEEAFQLAVQVTKLLLDRKRKVIISKEKDSQVATRMKKVFDGKIEVISKPDMARVCDLIVVLGGDGTFIGVARWMGSKSVPILGVNMGQLGFLTEIKKQEALSVLSEILTTEKINVSERQLLEVVLKRKGKVVFRGPVLNDMVISKGAIARIIELHVQVNHHDVMKLRADGIIVCTPTGSTAYSLAAGGPVIEPTLPAMVITPICPHALTHRSLVLPSSAVIQLKLAERPGEVAMTLDGQDVIMLKESDVVEVRQFLKHQLRIVSSPTRNYFSLLREKLKFGMRD